MLMRMLMRMLMIPNVPETPNCCLRTSTRLRGEDEGQKLVSMTQQARHLLRCMQELQLLQLLLTQQPILLARLRRSSEQGGKAAGAKGTA
jgi:hypothetical protein